MLILLMRNLGTASCAKQNIDSDCSFWKATEPNNGMAEVDMDGFKVWPLFVLEFLHFRILFDSRRRFSLVVSFLVQNCMARKAGIPFGLSSHQN